MLIAWCKFCECMRPFVYKKVFNGFACKECKKLQNQGKVQP